MSVSFYHRVAELLQGGQPFWVCQVIGVTGSTPREIGARMLVFDHGDIEYTLGGGSVEARVVRDAQFAPANARSMLRQYHLGDLGMHCGGLMEVSFERTPAKDLALYARAAQLMDERRSFLWACELAHPSGVVGKALFHQEEDPLGDATTIASATALLTKLPEQGDVTLRIEDCLFERVAPPLRLLIFGAGHVGARLAAVGHATGLFEVEVVDDRADYANSIKLPFCDRIQVAAHNYRGPLPLPDAQTYVAIITRCHATDKEVLSSLLLSGRPFAYLGMIGSVPKRARLFRMLRDEGVGAALLAQVTSPMGLPIGGKSPGEIAVSMLAQMIERKNRARSGGNASCAQNQPATSTR